MLIHVDARHPHPTQSDGRPPHPTSDRAQRRRQESLGSCYTWDVPTPPRFHPPLETPKRLKVIHFFLGRAITRSWVTPCTVGT